MSEIYVSAKTTGMKKLKAVLRMVWWTTCLYVSVQHNSVAPSVVSTSGPELYLYIKRQNHSEQSNCERSRNNSGDVIIRTL